jgi:Ca2+-dependent lipid-binding protein
VWNEDFCFQIRDPAKDALHVLVKDSDLGAFSADDPISRAKIPLGSLVQGQKKDQLIKLEPCKDVKPGGEVRLWLKLSTENKANW